MRYENTVILFIKAPQICRVKTRLWPDLNHRECLSLYRLLMNNAIKQLSNSLEYKFIVYSTEPCNRHSVPYNLTVKYQHGLDLGMRMHNAISEELKHAQRVILIGSDCVQFTKSSLSHALKQLWNKNDIVMTPTNDGGYCLVGMRRTNRAIFENVSWGTSDVFNQTKRVAEKSGKTINILETMHDIDTMNDLHGLKQRGELPIWAQSFIR